MNNTKEMVLHLHAAGYTQSEIAGMVGVTRQRVSQILHTGKRRKKFKPVTAVVCRYVNVRNWMNENKVSFAELARRVSSEQNTASYVLLRRWLCDGANITKKNIDRLIAATGLSYEKLFEVG